MTVASTTVARDEILTVLKTAWDAGAPTVPMLYPDTIGDPPATGSWARATVRHATGRQGSLADTTGIQRWTSTGILTVQIFAQIALGFKTIDPLADIVKNAFQGTTTPGGIWFRNARVVEVGRDGAWEQVNVLADFEYDQLQ